MKFLLAAILTVAMIVIGICIYGTFKEKHRLAKVVRYILLLGMGIVFFNLVTLVTKSQWVCLLGYSAYFVVSVWMLYYLLVFSIEYTGNDFEKHVNKRAMGWLLGADSLLIMSNSIYPYLYKLKEVALFGGESYYELEVSGFFYIHYAIVMMLVVFCLISLFYGAFKAPTFYRRKYMVIAVIMVVLVVLNIFTLTSAIDVSIIGYVVEGICIYYCTFVYTPQRLLQKTLLMVAKDMTVALFVLDIEGNKLYSNKMADKLLDTENPLVGRDGMTLEEWCRQEYMNYAEEFSRDKTFCRGEEERILHIRLQRMTDSHEQLQGGYFVIQDRTEEINALKKERWLATHDTLTGLFNKQYFFEVAEKYIRRHSKEELLLICTDIKDFKMINDFLGTKTGDIVLKNVAELLKTRLSKGIFFGRLGNDVFAVLMKKEDYAEALFEAGDQSAYFAGIHQEVAFAVVNYVGVYEITDRRVSISVMCDRARMAISKIKGDYHKRIAYYDEVLRENILHEQELIADLDKAISEEQLQMYLQPQMGTDGGLLGAEALIRWHHPEKGFILPSDFIPVFEHNGLISEVDRYIWELACRQLRRWKDRGREDIYISVNISPRDFYFLNIFQIFTELVEKYDISPKNLKLEITETAIVMDFQRQLELIKRLRQNGFVVEMDDFGSGYSSLNMLKDIHVDVLKIDMAFLKKAEDEERSKKILQMIIGLSKQLGMPVITEGIENAEQVAYLSEMGCEMFQGYYFAKPMSVDEFESKYLLG